MDATVYANYRKPETQRVAAEFAKRSGGRNFDASASYPYDAIQVIADVLERAASTDPDAIVAAIKKTNFAGGLSVSSGPIVFNETGDNPNASTAMLQVLGAEGPRGLAEGRGGAALRLPAPEGVSGAAGWTAYWSGLMAVAITLPPSGVTVPTTVTASPLFRNA